MTDPHPPPPLDPGHATPDDLASAVIDGVLDPAGTDRALQDPAVVARTEQFRALRARLLDTAPSGNDTAPSGNDTAPSGNDTAPSGEAGAAQDPVAAALAEFDRQRPGTSLQAAPPERDGVAAVPVPLRRRRRRPLVAGLAAAAALVVLLALGLEVSRSGDGDESAGQDTSSAATAEADGAGAPGAGTADRSPTTTADSGSSPSSAADGTTAALPDLGEAPDGATLLSRLGGQIGATDAARAGGGGQESSVAGAPTEGGESGTSVPVAPRCGGAAVATGTVDGRPVLVVTEGDGTLTVVDASTCDPVT